MNIQKYLRKKEKKTEEKKSKKKLIILFAIFLLLTGLAIAVYPYAISKFFDYRQQQLINKWLLTTSGIISKNDNDNPRDLDNPDSTVSYYPDNGELSGDEIFEEDINAFFNIENALNMMTGTLKIPSIDLISPILKGDTKDNLNIGVCEVRDSVLLGSPGNYILAGHYSRIRGRHFNRLPEIKPGASVFISDFFNIYEYEVQEVLQVRPEDTWAVPINIPEYTATLITCDYSMGEPYGRIVVKCILKQ